MGLRSRCIAIRNSTVTWHCLTHSTSCYLVFAAARISQLEAFIIALLIIIAGCFAIELALSQPIRGRRPGLHPKAEVVTNPAMLYMRWDYRRDGDAPQSLSS